MSSDHFIMLVLSSAAVKGTETERGRPGYCHSMAEPFWKSALEIFCRCPSLYSLIAALDGRFPRSISKAAHMPPK